MKAVIMAGGEGTRLRPLTCNRPKPMVPVANKPVMEHIIELLKKHKVVDIAVTLQYMPDLIKEYFGDGRDFGVSIKYFIEKIPLGTAGSVKNAQKFLDDTFIVISGDALTDIDLSKAIAFHHKKNSIATLVLKKVDIPLEYGVVVTRNDGRITRFLEKPSWGEVFSDTVNTGIYILSPEVLSYFDKEEVFDFSKDLFPMLLNERKPMYGYITEDYWCDIGDLKAYTEAHVDILDGKVKINIPGKQIKDKVWIGENTEFEENVSIQFPCIIGKNSKIKKNTSIGSYSVIGDCCIVGERSGLKRSIIWKNSIIDRNVQVRGSIVCNKVHLNDGASLFEHSVVGDDTIIGEKSIIKPNIKVWPNKIIDEGIELNSNLVWGSKFTRSIFGQRGLSGRVNTDITPEFASKLAASYGATFKPSSKIIVSCDDSTPAQMLKISFISGLMSAGVQVFDFGKILLPITRSAIRLYKADGGIHVSTCCGEVAKLTIDFLNDKGGNIDRGIERKIENVFAREDFSRCEGEAIKEIKMIHDYTNFYLANLEGSLKTEKLKYKIALNIRSEFVSNTIIELLTDLGCEIQKMHLNLNLNNKSNLADSVISNDINFFINYIKKGNFDLGVSVEDNCEKMVIFDHRGRIITEDMFIALVSMIFFKTIKGGTVIVPISASHVVEKIASENNGKVIRTKTSIQDMMNNILSNDFKQEMVEQFTMHFDAMAGLVKILDFMTQNSYRLSDLVDLIPSFYLSKKEVECSWNTKGRVIKEIIQENSRFNVETLEGVKVFNENGWVLVLPDSQQPICRVISESYSSEFAEELSNIYVNKVKEINRS